MKLVVTTAALVVAFATLGCSKDKEPPNTAANAEDKNAFEEVGGAVGGAAEDVGSGVKEGAVDSAEYTQIEGTHRYKCEDGTEFQIDYQNDGRSARVTMEEEQYWLDVESGTGRFSGKDGKFWTVGKDMASLELAGKPSLSNCEKQ